MEDTFVVVGLGNPGPRYALTRHNAGFIALDLWAQRESLDFQFKKDINAEIAEQKYKNKNLILIKPQTFMNLSGQSVNNLYHKKPFLRDYPLIVLHDEADLPFGRVKIKKGGGDAGNNGLKSIRAEIGTGDFFRLRIGVGKPLLGSNIELADYALQKFPKVEMEKLEDLMVATHNVLEVFINEGLEAAQVEAQKLRGLIFASSLLASSHGYELRVKSECL